MPALNPRARRTMVLLATLATAALTTRLGVWQLDRAAQKTAIQHARTERIRQPVLDAAGLARDVSQAPGQVHRRVQLQGRWDASGTVALDNRTMQGRSGFLVVTPLVLDDGRTVVVQRGWLPRDPADRTRLASYRTPTDAVNVQGRIALEPSRLYELGPSGEGPIRQNLDLAVYAQSLRRPLAPVVVIQDEPDPPLEDGLLRRWADPVSDVHKHHGYAFQWFGLSTLVVTLYVWFQLIKPRRRRTG